MQTIFHFVWNVQLNQHQIKRLQKFKTVFATSDTREFQDQRVLLATVDFFAKTFRVIFASRVQLLHSMMSLQRQMMDIVHPVKRTPALKKQIPASDFVCATPGFMAFYHMKKQALEYTNASCVKQESFQQHQTQACVQTAELENILLVLVQN